MRPYGVTERLFTVLRHILALGVVHHRAVAADSALGGFGLVQRIADGTLGRIGGGRGHAVQCAQLHGGVENAA